MLPHYNNHLDNNMKNHYEQYIQILRSPLLSASKCPYKAHTKSRPQNYGQLFI